MQLACSVQKVISGHRVIQGDTVDTHNTAKNATTHQSVLQSHSLIHSEILQLGQWQRHSRETTVDTSVIVKWDINDWTLQTQEVFYEDRQSMKQQYRDDRDARKYWITDYIAHPCTHTHTHTYTQCILPQQTHTQSLLWRFTHPLRFNSRFPGGPGLAGTRMSPFWILLVVRMTEIVHGNNWSYKTVKDPVKSSPPTNQHPTFYKPDALPVAQPSVKALKGNGTGVWKCYY